MSIDIIFEDEYILCVSKPNNVVVHHAKFSRQVSNENSLLQIIAKEKNIKVYPIHRLDRRTSGIILLAKQKKYVARFQDLFLNNKIQKTYYGIVRGFSPEEKVIDSPVKGRDAKAYKEALTVLQTLDTVTLDIPVKPYKTSRYSLVQLQPKTGRMHQLRIHTNKISHPLVGDTKYGDKNHNTMFVNNFNTSILMLHAGKLHFTHPYTGKKIIVKATFPKEWKFLFDSFTWKNPIVL